MAKKKTKNDEGGEVAVLDTRAKFFEDFADSIFSADHVMKENKKIISVSPAFDLMTGGVPEGCFVALTGKEKIGKSTLALSIGAQAQKLEYANDKLCPEGRHLFYFNAEHRIKERDLAGIEGINLSPDRFSLIQSYPGKILSAQDFCTRIERAINEVPGCIVIIDSFSILSSNEELAADIGYQDRGKSNGIVSQLMRKIAAPLCVNKCIVIGVTHGMANTSGYGPSWQEKSANALKYAEDIKLRGKSVEKWRTGTDEKAPQIGQKVEWIVDFAAVLAPGGTINSHIRYGLGLDRYSELADIAIEYGLIDKGGAWYQMSFLEGEDKEKKFNGLEQLRNALQSNPEWYKELRKQVYEISGVEKL